MMIVKITHAYDKRDEFDFHTATIPYLSSNIQESPAWYIVWCYVFVSLLIRYSRVLFEIWRFSV